MSRATICTRTAGQTDTIVDDVTGIYVPPGDAGAMRAAIERLLDDPGAAARLGAAGRIWVTANADIAVYADRFGAPGWRRGSSVMVPRIGFVLEQTLGHISHAANLRSLIGPDPTIEAVFAPIEYAVEGWFGRVPGYSNWTIRAGLRARRAIRAMRHSGRLDGLFIHTQVPAILSPDTLRRIPTVVSLDATPIQYDELGEHYGHARGSERMEGLKWRANRDCFARAAAVVAWAQWTKDGLADRYEVPPAKIHVIPPGVDYDRWASIGPDGADATRVDGSVRVLFVGGDFARKGGDILLDAIGRLRGEGLDIVADVVTRDEVPPQSGVQVHHGLGPNEPELIALYQQRGRVLPTDARRLPADGAVGGRGSRTAARVHRRRGNR